jgi:predicted RNA-binding Zn-ribbon protein involved in translation (DUF1610 family)
MLTTEQKQERLEARRKAKREAEELKRIESEKNQKPVSSITINIEWKKSRTWGYNPNCEAEVHFKDGSFKRSPVYKCSGCGYDKLSTVVSDVFNDYLKYKLWNMPLDKLKGGNGSNDNGNAPYGIHLYSDNNPHFGGGIGINCYDKISEYIGGKFERISSGKTFDVYKYIDLEK